MKTNKLDAVLARAQEDEIPPCPGDSESQLCDLPAVLPGAAVQALKVHPTMAGMVVAAVMRGLEAKAWFYSKGQKTWVEEVDYKTQLEAVKIYLANVEGLPVQRVLTITETRSEDPVAMMARSPALRQAVRKQLDAADRLAGSTVQK